MNIEAIRKARTLKAVREARALCPPTDWTTAMSLDDAARRREGEILEERDNLAICAVCWLLLGFVVLWGPL